MVDSKPIYDESYNILYGVMVFYFIYENFVS